MKRKKTKKTKKRITSNSPKLKTRRKQAVRRTIKRAPKKGARKKAKRPAAQLPQGKAETTVAVYEVIATQAVEEPKLEAEYLEEDFGE